MNWLYSSYSWCRDLIFTGVEWGANKITALVLLYYIIAIALIYLTGGALARLWRRRRVRLALRRREQNDRRKNRNA